MDQRPPEGHDDEELDLTEYDSGGSGSPGSRPARDTDSTEGVRIIGLDEAAEAVETGTVSGRRAEGPLRYDDRPESPSESRPALRFPLGDTSESADAPRPLVSGPDPSVLPHWTDPPTGEIPSALRDPDVVAAPGSEEDVEAWSSLTTSGPRWRDSPSDWDEPDYDAEAMSHDDETRVGALDESDRPPPDDYFDFGADTPTVESAGDRTTRTAARQTDPAGTSETRGHHTVDDQHDSDAGVDTEVREEPADADPVSRIVRSGIRSRAATGEPGRSSGRSGPDRDIAIAIATGVGLAVAGLILLSLGPAWAMVLVTGVLVVAAAELFSALLRAGYQPATLLGLVATGALALASYWKGETAIPLVVGLTVVATLLWYLIGVSRNQPTMNVAVSLFAVLYVGLLGSFAALILTFPDEHGVGVLIAVILAVVANDVGALFVGRRWGRARLAPEISPGKTIEGVIGGTVATLVVTVVAVGIIGWEPFDGVGQALALGLVVAVVTPLGDLCESMIKRDLGVKDMGSILPGHGGLLDRFDGLLFALPAAYYLCRLLEIA